MTRPPVYITDDDQRIRLIDLTPTGDYTRGDQRSTYGLSVSFPWIRTTTIEREQPREAMEDARTWLHDYCTSQPWARMGDVLGVARKGTGYVGVVNYFHSNT